MIFPLYIHSHRLFDIYMDCEYSFINNDIIMIAIDVFGGYPRFFCCSFYGHLFSCKSGNLSES